MQQTQILTTIANEFKLTPENLIQQGMRLFLEKQLRAIQTDIFQIRGRYGVIDVIDMEQRYQNGTLDEAESWQDYQRLDHLEYKQDRLLELLKGTE